MIKLRAKNKRKNIYKEPRGLWILIGFYVAAFLIALLSFVIFRNWFTLLATSICTFFLAYYITRPPKVVDIMLTDDKIKIGSFDLNIRDCESWAIVELDDSLEFSIRRSGFVNEYLYFYLAPGDPQAANFANTLSQTIPYDDQMPYQNSFHNWLRAFGLR